MRTISDLGGIVDSEASETPIAEQVFWRFLDLMQQGVLKPGQLLPAERDLAKMMKVGRPTLREALRALAIFGVLEIRQRAGIVILKPDVKSLLEPLRAHLALDAKSMDDLFEARIVIEAGVAELAATRLDRAQVMELEECTETGAAFLDDPVEFQKVDQRFHSLLSEAVTNDFLSWMTSSLWELSKASRGITSQLPGVLARSHRDHQRILDAVRKRDGKLSALLMREHIENVYAAYLLARTSLMKPGTFDLEEGATDDRE